MVLIFLTGVTGLLKKPDSPQTKEISAVGQGVNT